ncbi:hypothetical protein ABT282_30975 [Streptomyces sp. NPDC000927]|uniref:hypothetical protein n=1 Tax=Streptomyces sp. NPDC000927 TaxID=3154371 RepID=UPI00331DBB76
MGNCSSCSGSRSAVAANAESFRRGGSGRALSAHGPLPWIHTRGGASTRYATENEAKAAAKLFGGEYGKAT